MQLRPYQIEAYKTIDDFINSDKTSMCLQLPTGAGKSILIKNLAKQFQDKRILFLTHSAKLTEQNSNGLNNTAFYCAEINKKADKETKHVFATIQSLGRNPEKLGLFDIILVDEAHLVDNYKNFKGKPSQYTKVIQALKPPKIIGLTATPYRLEGKLYGEGKQFDYLGYELQTDFLIKEGYLCPYIFPTNKKTINASKVKITAGDFNLKDLQKLCEAESIVRRSVDEWFSYAQDRELTLFFCVGTEHAKLVAKDLERYMSPSEIVYIDGNTDDKNGLLDEIKANKQYRAIVSIGVLTTGVDIPRIDCICLLRPTKSTSLFIQMVGRGLRLSPDKKNCLIIDLGGNLERFGSINNPFVAEKGGPKERKSKDLQRTPEYMEDEEGFVVEVVNGDFVKRCKHCKTLNWPAAKKCQKCGSLFLSEANLFKYKQDMAEHERQVKEKQLKAKANDSDVIGVSIVDHKSPTTGKLMFMIEFVLDNMQRLRYYTSKGHPKSQHLVNFLTLHKENIKNITCTSEGSKFQLISWNHPFIINLKDGDKYVVR